MIFIFNSKEICFDSELTSLSFRQPINAEFTVTEILTEDLWKVYQVNENVYKCIPLFNCDKLVSSNAKDIVIEDNKCIILHVDDDTIINAVSDDVGSTHYYSLQLYAFTPYSKLDIIDEVVIYCIVYDEFLNTLNNITLNVLVDGYETAKIETNNQGIAKYTISEASEVSFEYDENLSNSVSIIGGE